MSDKLEQFTFKDILALGNIRIPRIQRGYAQGRTNSKVNDIRKIFLHTLFQVIRGNRPETELDFIYGSDRNGAFEPLDGQQRLTTLFLIHWMLGANLRRPDNDKKSVFEYASCPTSEDFSNALVRHDSVALIKEYLEEKQSIEEPEEADNFKLSDLLRRRDWFHWSWRYDPSIVSMLVMIDAVLEEILIDSDWESHLENYRTNLENIKFHRLNLGEFGLSNELFVKMNARGKQLSDFDKLKSTLEEEIQIQRKEKDADGQTLVSANVEADWRSLMDGKWSDYFWHKYARPVMTEDFGEDVELRDSKRLEAARICELQFKKLILRAIQVQLQADMPTDDVLREACYKRDEGQIDSMLSVYNDTLLPLRNEEEHQLPADATTIDFRVIMDAVSGLMFIDEGKTMKDVFALLPVSSRIDPNETLLESFLREKVPNDVALTFHAAMLFLHDFPVPRCGEKENDGYVWDYDPEANKTWLANFTDWVRIMRNILLNDNNNQRIDKQWRYEKAMESIGAMAHDFAEFVKVNGKDVENESDVVISFIASLKDKTYPGLDNQSLKEEIEKASLLLSAPGWRKALEEAEADEYLWGQIRSLLNWSDKDFDKFEDYSERLRALLEIIRDDSRTYYLTALTFRPENWVESTRLYQLNRHRDNSFKRYLRERAKPGQSFGHTLRDMIDYWEATDADKSATAFLQALMEKGRTDAPEWLKAMIDYPDILDYSYYKRIYKVDGHVVLAQLQTTDSHCVDPLLASLKKYAEEKGREKDTILYDSKGDYSHAFSLRNGEKEILVRWHGDDGSYSIAVNDGDPEIMDAATMIATMKSYIAPSSN